MTVVLAALLAGCGAHSAGPASVPDPRLAAAEALIDSFYSFDPARLRAAMAHAPASLPRLLYYQGWAEGGNYRIVDRKPCRFDKPDEVSCAITVKDDLVPALGIAFDVTDIFHLTFGNGRIAAVRNSSNDPPEFEQALQWIGTEHPEVLDGPCKGFFDDGPTPQACAREVAKRFAEFRNRAESTAK